MNKVSVIMPVYNSEKYLNECIDSVLNQDYQDIEIIIVNDGSTDSSDDIIKAYLNKDNRIVYVEQVNSGVSTARNKALEKVSGSYIMFLDSDDTYEKNMISTMVRSLKNNDIVVCGYNENYTNKCVKKKLNSININTEMMTQEILSGNACGYLWNKIFRTDIVKKNKINFDVNIHMCEDMLFVFEYLKHCKKIKLLSDCLYNYRMRKTSAVWQRNSKYYTIFNSYKKIEKIIISFNIKPDYLYYKVLFSYGMLSKKERRKFKKEKIFDVKAINDIILKSDNINKSQKVKLFVIIHFRFIYLFYIQLKVMKNKRYC